jgi:hypothetical protein
VRADASYDYLRHVVEVNGLPVTVVKRLADAAQQIGDAIDRVMKGAMPVMHQRD